MIIQKHPSGAPYAYVGDGVYAEWDGYQVWLRVDDILAPRVVALEPRVMSELNNFFDTMMRKTVVDEAKKRALDLINTNDPTWFVCAKKAFQDVMTNSNYIHDGDRIQLMWEPDITSLAPPLEDQFTAWINSFN